MIRIKVTRDGRPATAEELQAAVDGRPLPPQLDGDNAAQVVSGSWDELYKGRDGKERVVLLREQYDRLRNGQLGGFTWTNQALSAGGWLTLWRPIPGKLIFKARMEWPGGECVNGWISTNAQGALKNLEEALAKDCADEMIKNGAV